MIKKFFLVRNFIFEIIVFIKLYFILFYFIWWLRIVKWKCVILLLRDVDDLVKLVDSFLRNSE